MDICRLCMEASNLNHSMTDETIQVMVEDCIQIKLNHQNELLPLDICDDCYFKVKDFSEFKENCHAIQKMLQQEIEENRRDQEKASISEASSLLNEDIQYSDYIEDSLIFGELSPDDIIIDLQDNCSSNSDIDLDTIANEIFNHRATYINAEEHNSNDNDTKDDSSTIEQGGNTDENLLVLVNGYIDKNGNIKEQNSKTDVVLKAANNEGSKIRVIKRSYRKEYTSALLACEMCGKKVHKTLLPGHLNMHNGVKPYVCPREGCNSAFHCKHKLKRHLGYKHTDGNFPCKECDKVFNSNLALYHHQFASHQMPDKACKECDKKFRTTHGLNRHMLVHQPAEKNKCSHCPMIFANKLLLESHNKRHTTERPYVCSKCKADYSYRRLLINHIKRKHPGSEDMLKVLESTS